MITDNTHPADRERDEVIEYLYGSPLNEAPSPDDAGETETDNAIPMKDETDAENYCREIKDWGIDYHVEMRDGRYFAVPGKTSTTQQEMK